MIDAAEAAVQPVPVVMTFGRRVGIAVAVFLAARIISLLLHGMNVCALAYRLAGPLETLVQPLASAGIAIVVVLGAVYTLVQAQRSIAASKPHWLVSMPEQRLIATLIVLLLLSRVVPHVGWDASLLANPDRALGYVVALAMRAITFVLSIVACCAWIWWCNSPPRAERLVAVPALAWVGVEFLMNLLDLVAPALNVMLTRTYESDWTISLPGSGAYAHITGRSWIWNVDASNVLQSLWPWLTYVVVPIPIAAVIATLLYLMFNREIPVPEH